MPEGKQPNEVEGYMFLPRGEDDVRRSIGYSAPGNPGIAQAADLLDRCAEDLDRLERDVSKIEPSTRRPYPRMDYGDAIGKLQELGSDIQFGEDFGGSDNGVIAPLVGIIGTCQALEAIKYIAGVGENLVGYVLYLDSKYMDWRKLKLSRREQCPVCAA